MRLRGQQEVAQLRPRELVIEDDGGRGCEGDRGRQGKSSVGRRKSKEAHGVRQEVMSWQRT